MTKRSRGLEIKVGILVAVALAVLIGFIVTLSGFMLGSGYTLYGDFDYSGGIKPGAPVKVAGIKVGKVKQVIFMGGKLDEATGKRVQVRLELWLEDRTRESIRQDAEMFINAAGVLGELYIEIAPGIDYEKPPVAPGSTLKGYSPPRTDLLLSRLYEVLDSVSKILYDDRDLIRDLLRDSAGAVREANAMLKENRQSVSTLLAQAGPLATEATTTLQKVNQGIGDPQVIARAVRNADTLLSTANRSLGELTPPVKTLVEDATRVTGIVTEDRVDRAIAVADKAATAVTEATGLIDNVDGLVTDIRQGKGTAGALLVREELYADLRELLRDLKRNPWKLFWKE